MKWAPKLHLCLAAVWLLLVVPTLLWWSESVLWVILISIYANVVGHWSSYQAAHAEKRVVEKLDGGGE